MVSTTIGEEEITVITIMIGIIGPIIEIEIGQEMAMEIGEMMGKIIEEISYRHDNGGQRYGNRSSSQDQGRSRPRYRSNSQDNSNSRNRYSNNRDQSRSRDRRQRSRTKSRDRENSGTRSRSSSQISTNRDRFGCYRCNEYYHFARECPNALTDDSSDELEDDTSVLDYSEMGFDEDLNM